MGVDFGLNLKKKNKKNHNSAFSTIVETVKNAFFVDDNDGAV